MILSATTNTKTEKSITFSTPLNVMSRNKVKRTFEIASTIIEIRRQILTFQLFSGSILSILLFGTNNMISFSSSKPAGKEVTPLQNYLTQRA